MVCSVLLRLSVLLSRVCLMIVLLILEVVNVVFRCLRVCILLESSFGVW